MSDPAAPSTPLHDTIAAGERYATRLEQITPGAMTRAGRDAIDRINKRINAAIDNVFGFELPN